MAAGPKTSDSNGMVELPYRVAEREFYQLVDKDGSNDDIRSASLRLRPRPCP